MRKKIKFPTIIGMLILVLGLAAGLFLINSSQIFKLSANVQAIPKNVRVTNITDSGITVTWTTDIESVGFVKWGESVNSITKVASGDDIKSFVHSINIDSNTSTKSIFFEINSNGTSYKDEGLAWKTDLKNSGTNSSNSLIASGLVLMQDGNEPAKAIVYLTINGIFISGTTSDEGNFVIPISNFVENIEDATIVNISVNSGTYGSASATIYLKNIKSIPTIILGRTYDFRSINTNETTALPKSTLSVPESVELSSRFEVTSTEKSETNNVVTLDSISNGETITTIDPEFFGKGPANTEIEVKVESELQEAMLSTDEKGIWKWSPPNNLEEGEHKVTLKWKDASGVIKTLTRTFVIQASEGPAFESTPSATPLESNAPIMSPTPKPSSTTKATAQPTPETGGLAPTVGLFIMGIGILLSSAYVWRRSDVY